MTKSSKDTEDQFVRSLKARAGLGKTFGTAAVTAGTPNEPELARRTASNGLEVIKRPDDPQGILRISVGGGDTPVAMDYCVIRGDTDKCIKLLEKALAALKEYPQS